MVLCVVLPTNPQPTSLKSNMRYCIIFTEITFLQKVQIFLTLISSSSPLSVMVLDMRDKNSSKSISPFPSSSISITMVCNSSSEGSIPKDLITVSNSLIVMDPSPSLSNSANASRNSASEHLRVSSLTWVI